MSTMHHPGRIVIDAASFVVAYTTDDPQSAKKIFFMSIYYDIRIEKPAEKAIIAI
jgi:hypothetical protein